MPQKAGSRSTVYECPRCGTVARSLGNYKHHAGRHSLCEPKDAASRHIVPSEANAIVLLMVSGTVVRIDRGAAQANAGGGGAVSVDASRATTAHSHNNTTSTAHSHNTSTNTHSNNTHSNNTTNITTHINLNVIAPAAGPEPAPFPKQNTAYMTDEFKQTVARLAAAASGFNDALQEMFKAAYFCQSRPHNMNIMMPRPGDTAMVRDANRRWVPEDGDEAVRKMIENQTETMECMREEMYQAKQISKAAYDAFDKTWDALPNLYGDEAIQAHVKDLAMRFTDQFVEGDPHNITEGVAACKALAARRAAAEAVEAYCAAHGAAARAAAHGAAARPPAPAPSPGA